MQISMKQMKFKAAIDIRMKRKNVSDKNENGNFSMNHFCSDCRVSLIRQQMEFVCPKCGMVEELIEGSE